jgi:hypothetical protein
MSFEKAFQRFLVTGAGALDQAKGRLDVGWPVGEGAIGGHLHLGTSFLRRIAEFRGFYPRKDTRCPELSGSARPGVYINTPGES